VSTIPAFQSGLTGVQSGLQQLNKNAADIASLGQPESDVDLASTLVSNLSAQQQVEASLKVIEASNATIGTLLDIKA
jgi:flagellar hook protein FlgE